MPRLKYARWIRKPTYWSDMWRHELRAGKKGTGQVLGSYLTKDLLLEDANAQEEEEEEEQNRRIAIRQTAIRLAIEQSARMKGYQIMRIF
jgi:hypothetical protein